MDVKEIRIEDFDYPLDDNRIAKYPLAERDTSNLLYWKQGIINKYHFYNLPELLEEGDLLIYNNTKVIQARFHFKKTTGSTIEIFCLEPHSPIDYNLAFQSNKRCEWKCLVGNLKKWKEESITNSITIKGHSIDLTAKRLGKEDDMTHIIEFSWNEDDITFSDILLYFGELPIPPYLNRATEEKDKTTYQTVYSKIDGSVAAPTAGLRVSPHPQRGGSGGQSAELSGGAERLYLHRRRVETLLCRVHCQRQRGHCGQDPAHPGGPCAGAPAGRRQQHEHPAY